MRSSEEQGSARGWLPCLAPRPWHVHLQTHPLSPGVKRPPHHLQGSTHPPSPHAHPETVVGVPPHTPILTSLAEHTSRLTVQSTCAMATLSLPASAAPSSPHVGASFLQWPGGGGRGGWGLRRGVGASGGGAKQGMLEGGRRQRWRQGLQAGRPGPPVWEHRMLSREQRSGAARDPEHSPHQGA